MPQLHPWRISGTKTCDPAPQAVPLNPNPQLRQIQQARPAGRPALANSFGAFGSTGAAQQDATAAPNSGSSLSRGMMAPLPAFAVVDCAAPKLSGAFDSSHLSQNPYSTGQPQVLTSKGRGEAMGGAGSTVATIEVEGKSSIST